MDCKKCEIEKLLKARLEDEGEYLYRRHSSGNGCCMLGRCAIKHGLSPLRLPEDYGGMLLALHA